MKFILDFFKILLPIFVSFQVFKFNFFAKINENSWVLNSEFNYKYPKDSILNLAYPSAIAQYYVTIIPPESKYLLLGEFLQDNMYESSLTIYTENGNINKNYPSLNSYSNDFINITIDNNTTQYQYIFQRYYANMNYYTKKDFINNLAVVYNLKTNNIIKKMNSIERDYFSILINNPLGKIITEISPKSKLPYNKFYLPEENTNGLFPDDNHYYLFANLGDYEIIKITGQFLPSKITPYMDFIIVDQTTTETNYGLPFYELDENYYLYVASPSIKKKELDKLNITSNILKWKDNNLKPAIIFRLIDYSGMGITNTSGPLNPFQTKKTMDSIREINFYPEISIYKI